MKKLFTFFILAACLVIMGNTANAQTTIAGQDFDATTSMTYTNTNGATKTGTSATGDRPQSTAFYSNTATAWSVANAATTVTFSNVTGLSSYISKYFEFRLASWSIGSTGNGADAADSVAVYISTDGGTTWSDEVRVNGNTNAWWSYSATGNATVTYDGNLTPTQFTPAGGGQRTTDGYSTMRVNLPDGCTQARIRIYMLNNSANELWTIDEVYLKGTLNVTPTLTIADNGTQPGAGSINQSSTNNILQTFTVTEGNTAAATLNTITIPLAGNYLAADLVSSGVKLWAGTTNSFGSASNISSKTAAATGSGETITFNSLSYAISQNTAYYFWVTVDVSATANTSRNINASGLTASNFTFASGTPTGTVSAGGSQTFAAVTPSIAITGASPGAGTINQNTTNNILYSTQLDVTVANATLNSYTVTTAGTYQTSDLQASSFKFWINSANNLTGATQLGSGQTIVSSGNTVGVTGLSTVITSGTTRYILVTCDVAYNANTSRNISITSTPFTGIVFATGNKTGTDPAAAGSAQTFGAVTPSIAVTGLGPSSGSTGRSATNVNLYQMSFAVTSNSTDLNSIVVTTGGTYVSGDLVASSFKLWYNTANNFGTASQIGTSQAIVNTGNTITFSGLTQNIVVGTTGYVWVTVDISASATFSNTINITSTPFANLTFSQGTKTGTDPAAVGGTITINPVSSATDFFRTNSTIAGTWASYNSASSWESSPDSSSWITSTLVPTSSAARVIIRNGHTISLVTGSTTLGRLMVLNGGIFKDSSATSSIADGADYDVIIQNGGRFTYNVNSTNPTFSGSAKMLVQSGGVLQITGTGMTGTGVGMNSSSIDWETGAICDYNTTNAISSSGITYFPTATNTIPIFRLSANVSAGAGTGTIFNGTFQIANGVTMTWSGNSTKTFRNGITTLGTGAMTTSGGTGTYAITGTTAELGGTGGTLTITNSNGVTVSTGSTLTVTGTTVLGATTLTGTGTAAYSGTSGSISLNALSQASGFANSFGGTFIFTGSSLPSTSCSNLTLSNATTLTGNLTVSGTLTLNNTLAVGSNTLTISSPLAGTLTNLTTTSSSNITVSGNSPLIHIPSTVTALNNLTISNNQVVTADANITVGGTYDQSNGILVIGTLEIGTGTGNVGALTRTAGSVRGTIKRWFTTATTSGSLFPLDNGSAAYVGASISFTGAPATGGSLTAVYHTSGSGTLSDNGGLGYIPASQLGVNFINLAPQYWTINAGDGLAGYTYNIQLIGNSMNVSTTNYQYTGVVKRADNTQPWGWNFSNHVTTTSPSAVPTLGGTGFTSFSDFGIGGNQDNLLPVEFTAFTSAVSGRNVNLNWATMTETNNSGFDVERKSTTTGWTKIGSVTGHGTTNQQTAYSYSDANVPAGKFNYRLKQIDYNGNYHYYELSNEVIIGAPTKYSLAQNFPNPFNPSTSISYEIPNSNFVSLKIYDMMGKEVANLVNENQEAGFYTVKFDASKLSSGVYFYKLVSDKFTSTKKLMLMK